VLSSALLSLEIVAKLSKNVIGQTILLYTEYSQTVYKPSPILSYHALLENIE